MQEIIKKDNKFILNTYDRFKVVLKSGRGCFYKDINGKKYLDFSSGIAVNTIGASQKKWVKHIHRQLKTLAHSSNLYYTIPQVELAQTLCKKTGAKKVFFSNSGAESNECAIKAARKYSFDKYGAKRHKILTLDGSFHGRTMATLSATGQNTLHPDCFSPYLDGFIYVNPNDIKDLKSKITDDIAAIMIELIQGESGVNTLDKAFVQEVYNVCKNKDILLIVDEVQTGNGRTGSLYAFEQFDIQPDILTTAKGLAGGLPLGATLFFDKTEFALSFGQHGSTFGGNLISCASANYILDNVTDRLLLEVKEKGNYIKQKLLNIKQVKSISGLGLMIGIEVDNASEVAKKCLEKGLLVILAKHKVRFLPPLNISYKEIDFGLNIFSEVLK